MNTTLVNLANAKFIQTEFEPFDLSEEISSLLSDLKKVKQRVSKKHSLAIELILANLYSSNQWIIIPLGKKNSFEYKKNKITGLVLSEIVHFLKEKDIINIKIGFKDKVKRATRIKLKKRIKNFKVSRSFSHIILKDNQKLKINKTNSLYEKNLRKINNFLSNLKVTFEDKEIPFQPYYRVFNKGSFKYGGRFFGHPLNQSKKIHRKLYKINDRQIIEVDFINFAINFLYQKENSQPHEAYIIKNYLRKDVKKALNTIINASSKGKAKQAIYNETSIKNIEQFIKDVEEKHSKIKKYFYTGIGLRIQKIESRITEDVLLKAVKRNIVVFPLHDAFITIRKHQKEVALMMLSSYKQMTKQKFIEVKIKTYR